MYVFLWSLSTVLNTASRKWVLASLNNASFCEESRFKAGARLYLLLAIHGFHLIYDLSAMCNRFYPHRAMCARSKTKCSIKVDSPSKDALGSYEIYRFEYSVCIHVTFYKTSPRARLVPSLPFCWE
eukprot:scaffold1289_cov178-Amphora_coffeaeformis.AAC.3